MRSIRKKEFSPSASNAYAKDNDDPGPAANVRRFSELLYAQIDSRQRGSMDSLSSETGYPSGRVYYPQDEIFDPYAAAGVPHYHSHHPYRRGSGGSFSESPTPTVFPRNQERTSP
ncbi:hypothetical protein FS837_011230 [Tulasnella sp. UAMH 9824]|nr:hypothetical protein FS837_011230 [Tulasnella sp. UAMH 9824]